MDFRLSAEDWGAGTSVSMFYEEVPVFSNDAGVIMTQEGGIMAPCVGLDLCSRFRYRFYVNFIMYLETHEDLVTNSWENKGSFFVLIVSLSKIISSFFLSKIAAEKVENVRPRQ